ncbi:hypothetical protein L2E82_51348 [Cichorium intybus]|nr:hypothetical protein L2E82_51348 [Cichorium intybus]
MRKSRGFVHGWSNGVKNIVRVRAGDGDYWRGCYEEGSMGRAGSNGVSEPNMQSRRVVGGRRPVTVAPISVLLPTVVTTTVAVVSPITISSIQALI